MMGSCASCMRVILDAEADVKIHVIEPTTIVAPEQSVAQAPPTPPRNSPLLQVPPPSSLRIQKPTGSGRDTPVPAPRA
uniref:Ferredoxin n=1 Tax=Steinernema glaseri TaxID=37863 RepID=A0A1I7YV06_9BILA